MINNFKDEKRQEENEDVSSGQAKYYDDSNVKFEFVFLSQDQNLN